MRGILSVILSFVILQVNAQGINFQGVARSANGTIIASSNISLRLSIISKNVDATPEYVETKTVVTNAQGIFSVVVGDATNATVVGGFKNINWSDGPKFLKVEMDPAGGANFINMGATQLQYVPYSFYSFGVDASGVKGILPVEKGGTGVASLNALKTALNLPAGTIDTISLSNRIDAKVTRDSAVFTKDIIVNGITIGTGSRTSTNTSNVAFGKSALISNTLGYRNTAIGDSVMRFNTTGRENTAIGLALPRNTTGNGNISIGNGSLLNNDSGNENIAIGKVALLSNISASENIGIGNGSLYWNLTGEKNTAIGNQSLYRNTTSSSNVAVGYKAMINNTTGSENTAIGFESLKGSETTVNNTGQNNTAVGYQTLWSNNTGGWNVAIGMQSLKYNTIGVANTAIGIASLLSNTQGDGNTALGANALPLNTTGENNIAIGNTSGSANTTGSYNVVIGASANMTNSNLVNAIAIGSGAIVSNSNTIQLGNTAITEVKTTGVISSSGIRVGTISPTTSAVVEINSTTQGLLPPRMTQTQRDAISSPATGLVIFNTTSNSLEYKSSTSWVSLSVSSPSSAVFLPTIVIGNQQWMKENLDVVTYRNGDIIPQVSDAATWASLTTGAWCYYDNDPINGSKYGKLYNWFALNDPRGLAPSGWHLPTKEEWNELTDKLGGINVAGGSMKQVDVNLWDTPNTGATNLSGFTGLAAGARFVDGISFYGMKAYGNFWSISEVSPDGAWVLRLNFNNSIAESRNGVLKGLGFSVRCVRD